ncbi:V-type ATP synthase subunit A [Anaerotalea alkaliphila]|uniref:V-type ATP synthase alpha chain n=1 Tax=Anaerotalea alkaliphila TaxID=2662126 RepID=A0A7X5KM34_9FIRM|nr:V-type ATP synthase subunit A [Anaerotalea alkaliphila]NDL66539.1 V-type ATP synthase subunit A [Anaerotalea alkaliphila]
MKEKGKIVGVNGPVLTIGGSRAFEMMEMVYVGWQKLIGEVIAINRDNVIVQVYENTTGLKVGEPVYSSEEPMSLQLGPGIVGGVFDGIQRPLPTLEALTGPFIGRGLDTQSLDPERYWDVEITVKVGQQLEEGVVYALVPETGLLTHRVMVPPGMGGTVVETVPDGEYKVNDTVVTIKNRFSELVSLSLCQRWPVRKPRPFRLRHPLTKPLVTGQRVIDTLFPIAKGGAAAVPGSFGTGKTMTQHQLAKWSDADLIVYIGCGERGNEITEVLEDFPKLTDPRSGRPLMERTILIANTSNMPVAAREASIYTGITIAEYYRDMGYHVAIMADSTSRWAEALREISGRLEEMPAEEGFPAYLPSRLSQFYERAGYVENLNRSEGSVSIIGAVSPQGGDFSEPVTQNTKRFIRCFWALDRQLAYSRHYPAIHWLTSYSEYTELLEPWYEKEVAEGFQANRKEILRILQEESKLMEIVKLIGSDILPEEQKLTLEVAKLIRVGFLQQNIFHDVDTFVTIQKQYKMMRIILHVQRRMRNVVEAGIPVSQIRKTGLLDELVKMKYAILNQDLTPFVALHEKIDTVCDEVIESYRGFERTRSS